jgi:hypothetical protein
MRKIVACVGAALLLLGVVAPGSSAAVTAGAACKKAGQVSTAGGMKYTCVKKGSKLVWGKGIAVKAAPSISASAAPSASATVEVKPSVAPSAKPSASAEQSHSSGYTMTRVKANDTAASCWTVVSGNVYDLTKWIDQHPGGSGAIKSLCGTDGTAAFNGMHQGQGKPASRLSGYLLGPLAK